MRIRTCWRRFAYLLLLVFAGAQWVDSQEVEKEAEEVRAGVNGVSAPRCVYCPNPEYSKQARKSKTEGTVKLDVTVTSEGRIINPKLLSGPGMGLNENAIAVVKKWKMKPAIGPNGKPVNCRVEIEVTFHLFKNHE